MYGIPRKGRVSHVVIVQKKKTRAQFPRRTLCIGVVFLHSLLEDILLVLLDTIALELLERASLAHPELVADIPDEALVVRNNHNASLELLQCTCQSID